MFCHGNFSNNDRLFAISEFILRGTRSTSKKYPYAYPRQFPCCRNSKNIWIVRLVRCWLYSCITMVKAGAFVNKWHIYPTWTFGNSRVLSCNGRCSKFYSGGTTFYRIFDWFIGDRNFFHYGYYWWMEFISIKKIKLSNKFFAAEHK